MSEGLQPGGEDRSLGQISSELLAEVQADSSLEDRVRAEILWDEYAGGPENLQARQGFYDLAVQPFDFDKAMVDWLKLSPGSTFLDVGCGAGRALTMLSAKYGGAVQLIGVDKNPSMFIPTARRLAEAGLAPIDFMGADGERLPLPDNSVDGSSSLFSAYHTLSPAYLLAELKRVTKDGCPVVIATSGNKNKLREHQFESELGRVFFAEPQKDFATAFDHDNALLTLGLFFKMVRHRPQLCEVHVTDEADYQRYSRSLMGRRSLFTPVPSIEQYTEAMNEIVRPKVFKEIESRGFFKDYAERHIYFCVNESGEQLTLE